MHVKKKVWSQEKAMNLLDKANSQSKQKPRSNKQELNIRKRILKSLQHGAFLSLWKQTANFCVSTFLIPLKEIVFSLFCFCCWTLSMNDLFNVLKTLNDTGIVSKFNKAVKRANKHRKPANKKKQIVLDSAMKDDESDGLIFYFSFSSVWLETHQFLEQRDW